MLIDTYKNVLQAIEKVLLSDHSFLGLQQSKRNHFCFRNVTEIFVRHCLRGLHEAYKKPYSVSYSVIPSTPSSMGRGCELLG